MLLQLAYSGQFVFFLLGYPTRQHDKDSGLLESKTFEKAAEIHQVFGTCCVNKYLASVAGTVINCMRLLAKITKAPKSQKKNG